MFESATSFYKRVRTLTTSHHSVLEISCYCKYLHSYTLPVWRIHLKCQKVQNISKKGYLFTPFNLLFLRLSTIWFDFMISVCFVIVYQGAPIMGWGFKEVSHKISKCMQINIWTSSELSVQFWIWNDVVLSNITEDHLGSFLAYIVNFSNWWCVGSCCSGVLVKWFLIILQSIPLGPYWH